MRRTQPCNGEMLWAALVCAACGADPSLHEGGHGFHQLVDEYDGSENNCGREFEEVNSTTDAVSTAGEWDLWPGWDQAGATGMQTTIEGSRYCKAGQFRPSDNSLMNLLFGDKPNTANAAVSREKLIMDVWRAVTPIDETTIRPNALRSYGATFGASVWSACDRPSYGHELRWRKNQRPTGITQRGLIRTNC